MDDSLLIEQVAFFPFLYDKKEQRFKSKIARENAWKTIGEILEETRKFIQLKNIHLSYVFSSIGL